MIFDVVAFCHEYGGPLRVTNEKTGILRSGKNTCVEGGSHP